MSHFSPTKSSTECLATRHTVLLQVSNPLHLLYPCLTRFYLSWPTLHQKTLPGRVSHIFTPVHNSRGRLYNCSLTFFPGEEHILTLANLSCFDQWVLSRSNMWHFGAEVLGVEVWCAMLSLSCLWYGSRNGGLQPVWSLEPSSLTDLQCWWTDFSYKGPDDKYLSFGGHIWSLSYVTYFSF